MNKIISLYQRDYDSDRLVFDAVVEGAEWVLAGEGEPTRKWDGTAVLMRDGLMFKRYTVKPGRTPPPDFVPVTEVNEHTGKQEGWVSVTDGPEDQYHREAGNGPWPDGTYELVGPKIQGGIEKAEGSHTLVAHGLQVLEPDPGRTFDSIRNYLVGGGIEGIVWHHPDGRMAKIKSRDFGIPWPRQQPVLGPTYAEHCEAEAGAKE